MQTKDHWLLSKYMIYNGEAIFVNRLQELAFVTGCLEPDINLITYLQGMLLGKAFAGHDYINCYPYVKHVMKHLYHKETWGLFNYFQFGRLMHYIQDSFTHSHNQSFCGNIKQHCEYERKLHQVYSAYLKKHNRLVIKKAKPKKEIDFEIEKMHQEYSKRTGNVFLDCKYSLDAADLLLNARLDVQSLKLDIIRLFPKGKESLLCVLR